jgi:uncharacterized SAM-binding protein YcdF (DUF218 family)
LAFWFGALSLVNVLASVRHPVFDANLWWIDFRFLPSALRSLLVVSAGVLLVAYAVRPSTQGWRRTATIFAVAVLVIGALINTVTFYRAWAGGRITPGVPVPLSLALAAMLALIGVTMLSPVASPTRTRRAGVIAITSALFVLGMPLMQQMFFGTTDYGRPAQAIVVFGAQVNPGGVASKTLADRVFTAAQLYREGLAPMIIMSGGVEPNGFDETLVMRDLAEQEGVPASAIVLDPHGVNTLATVNDTVAMFRLEGISRVLVVSHFYHLPRIKLAYAGAGYDVWTVPSRDTPIVQTPYLVVREIPAFWVYYLRAAV